MSTVTILCTRSTGTNGGKPYMLSIIDDVSGCTVCEVSMEPAEFAAMLTGASTQGVAVEWRGVGNIGKVREIKEVDIDWCGAASQAQRALEPYEVDGWKGRASDLTNRHRSHGGKQRVTFVRFVAPGIT